MFHSRRYLKTLVEMNEFQRKTVEKVILSLAHSKASTDLESSTTQSPPQPSLPRDRLIQLIQGPPGTGKTTTISNLLSVVACSGYRSIVCAPTNVAVAEVALRFLRFFYLGGPPTFADACSLWRGGVDHRTTKLRLGDIVLTGKRERMKIGVCNLEKIYVGSPVLGGSDGRESAHVEIVDRGARIKAAMMPDTGWACTAHEVVIILESRQWKSYLEKVERGTREQQHAKNEIAPKCLRSHMLRLINTNFPSFVLHGNTLCDDLPTKFLSGGRES